MKYELKSGKQPGFDSIFLKQVLLSIINNSVAAN